MYVVYYACNMGRKDEKYRNLERKQYETWSYSMKMEEGKMMEDEKVLGRGRGNGKREKVKGLKTNEQE